MSASTLAPRVRGGEPPGFQRVGWQSLSLVVPDQWNLQLHDGDRRSGAIVFADLRRTRLEVRWQTPRKIPLLVPPAPERYLARTLRRLCKNHPQADVQKLSSTAASITGAQGILLLASTARRRYELHWPRAADESQEPLADFITHDFLHHLAANDGRREYFWSVYGAAGWVPAAARLRKASLLPGATTLSFKHKNGTTALGAFSMADRLLANRPLRDWATTAIALIADHPQGHWHEADDQATFTADTRHLWRAFRDTLVFRHDRAANRIAWSHHFAPVVNQGHAQA